MGTGLGEAELDSNVSISCVTLDRPLTSLSLLFIHSNLGIRNPCWRVAMRVTLTKHVNAVGHSGPVQGERSVKDRCLGAAGSECRQAGLSGQAPKLGLLLPAGLGSASSLVRCE